MELVERVCAAYARQRALGHQSSRDELCCVVHDERHPQLWAANHVSAIRAHTRAEIEAVLARAEQAFAHCDHRLFVVDPLTPAPFVATLAQADYNELTPTILLALEGALRAQPRGLEIRAASSEADWHAIAQLVGADHSEGARSHGRELPPEVTAAMVASYRGKAPDCQFFIARVGRVDCAYGAGVTCGDDIGVIEDLFTLPAYRRRGMATAIIACAVEHLYTRGTHTILIGAHATERPKRLYAALGFAPVCLTREYIRQPGD